MMSFFSRKPTRTLKLQLQFIVEPDEGGFHAFSPVLKGLHVDGATEEQAAANFVAAIPAYLESLARHNEPLPLGIIVECPPSEYDVPQGAFLRHIRETTIAWPSQDTSGIS